MKPLSKQQTISEKVNIQTYYTNEDGRVYLHQKVGDGEWTKTQTYYKEIPFTEFKSKQQTISEGNWEKELEQIMDKNTTNLTKTGDKDFNPPEIINFDKVVFEKYQATLELKDFIRQEKQKSFKEAVNECLKLVGNVKYYKCEDIDENWNEGEIHDDNYVDSVRYFMSSLKKKPWYIRLWRWIKLICLNMFEKLQSLLKRI